MAGLNPLDWASVGMAERDPQVAWAKLFGELSNRGFEACSASVMSFGNYALPAESHGTMVSQDFEVHIRENPEITQSLDVMGRFAESDRIIAANSKHPDYAIWSDYDRSYLRCMGEFGFRGGLAASVHDPMRGKFTFITASCLTGEEEAVEAYDLLSASLLPSINFMQEGLCVRQLAEQDDFQPLSPREQECLTWVCSGLMNSAIADRMGLSEFTVQEYIRNASRKLGARTRAQAAARATMLSMIQP